MENEKDDSNIDWDSISARDAIRTLGWLRFVIALLARPSPNYDALGNRLTGKMPRNYRAFIVWTLLVFAVAVFLAAAII